MPALIGDLAEFSGPVQQAKALEQIGAAPAVGTDAVSTNLLRSTVRLTDIDGNVSWDDGDIWAAIREIRKLVCSGGTLVSTSTLDPAGKPYQVTDALGNVIDESDTLGILPDNVIARGSRTSLMARLGSGLTPYGDPIGAVYGSWLLRETRMRLRKMLLAESQQLVIGIIGDSYTQYAPRYTQAVASTLQTAYGDAGVGWIGFGWSAGDSGSWVDGGTQPSILDGSVRPDIITVLRISGAWACSYNTGANNTPSLSKITSSTAGDYVRFTVPSGHDVAKLYYAGDGTGVVQVSWDNGSSYGSSINLTTVGAAVVDLGTVTTGSTARIKVISGNVTLAGVDLQKSTATGVRVHKLGGSGSNSGHWAAVTQATWAAQLLSLNPKLVMVLLATNDQGSSITPAASATNIGTIVTNIRSVLPYSDVLVMTPAENQRTTNPYLMTAYAQAQREYAVANNCAFLDFQYYFGSPANNAFEYAYANSARQWYASDLIHPDPTTGGRVMADAILRLLTTAI